MRVIVTIAGQRDGQNSIFLLYFAFMESTCQSSLQALLDKEAIRDCLLRYCRGVDRADEAVLRSTYWPDAHDRHGTYVGSADGFIAGAMRRLRSGGRGVHQITNCTIELHGWLAAVETSFFALQTTAVASDSATFLCGRYLDRFERRDGEWRVADRTVVYDWIEERTREDLARDDTALFGRRQPTGRRDESDPLHALLADVRTKAASRAA